MARISELAKKCEVKREDGVGLSDRDLFLGNQDMLPIPVKNRTWGALTYSLFWFGECASVTSWTVASTALTAGLTWYEAWLCVIFGHLIVACFMVATGRPGAVLHVGFPVVARSSFGIFGSYWPIVNRDCMTIIWTGVQGVTAGNCIYVLLHSIFPSIANVPNPFSSDVTMTGGRLIGYSVGWVLTLGLCFFEVHKFRKLIFVKAALMIFCLFAFFIWMLVKAHGAGPVIHQPADIPAGSSHGWVFVRQLFIQAANMATFGTNNADITRYASRPKNALLPQLLGMPIAFGVVGFFGLFVTSASKTVFGEIYWDPTLILDGLLVQDYSAKTRCGVFFIALGFSFAQVTTQIFANLISAGNDTSSLWPRYINIRRGAIICLVLSFAITPWNLSKSSFSFTSYLGSYQIFLSSIIGVIISDYYFVRRGQLHISELFSGSKSGLYYFNKGFNWRGYAAYIIGIIPCFPGFLNAVGVSGIPTGAVRLYYFALPVGIVIAAVAYYGLNVWMPPPGGLATEWREFETGEYGRETESLNGEPVEVEKIAYEGDKAV